jgi:hypothetical protein
MPRSVSVRATISWALGHGAGTDAGCLSEKPVIASSMSAQSSASRAIGPATFCECQDMFIG